VALSKHLTACLTELDNLVLDLLNTTQMVVAGGKSIANGLGSLAKCVEPISSRSTLQGQTDQRLINGISPMIDHLIESLSLLVR
jgi:hypothetical protein